jgi:hypothetical protein
MKKLAPLSRHAWAPIMEFLRDGKLETLRNTAPLEWLNRTGNVAAVGAAS